MSLADAIRPQAVPTFEPRPDTEPLSSKAATAFCPQTHIGYSPPPRVLTMHDLKLGDASPISSFAATEPFPLLTPEAVLAHRRELFSNDVLDNCYFPTRAGSAAMLRGVGKYAPFIQAFWNSPELLKIVSDLAGIDLVPMMDYEVAHANVQLGSGGVAGMRDTPVMPPAMSFDQGSAEKGTEAQAPAGELVRWHKDSYAFVCVVMLSDARGMEGGETVLRAGDGSTISTRAPQMGGAVLLQGRYIEHVALPATNMPERITVITSFRPRDHTLPDDNSLLNVRTESQLSEMFYQWTKYRLASLADRTRDKLVSLEKKYENNVRAENRGGPGMCRLDTVSYGEMKQWVEEQVKFLQQTLHEIRPVDDSDPW